jgi:hypothetical protein
VTGINRGRIDMATPYLREAPRFIGVNNLRFVPIRPTSGSVERIRAARASAHRRPPDSDGHHDHELAHAARQICGWHHLMPTSSL